MLVYRWMHSVTQLSPALQLTDILSIFKMLSPTVLIYIRINTVILYKVLYIFNSHNGIKYTIHIFIVSTQRVNFNCLQAIIPPCQRRETNLLYCGFKWIIKWIHLIQRSTCLSGTHQTKTNLRGVIAPTVLQVTVYVYVKLHVLNSQNVFIWRYWTDLWTWRFRQPKSKCLCIDAECISVVVSKNSPSLWFSVWFSEISTLYFLFNHHYLTGLSS